MARVRPPSSSPGLNRHINISNPQNQRIENVGNHYCMLGISFGLSGINAGNMSL